MLHQLSTRLLHVLTADRIVLDLSPWVYTLFHLCVVSVQAVCVAYLIFMGRAYYFIDHPYMEYYADLLAPAENRHLNFFGTAFYIIAGLHGLHVLWILYDEGRRLMKASRSCRARCCSDGSRVRSTLIHPDKPGHPPHPPPMLYKSRKLITSSGRRRLLEKSARSLFGREGFFGVESPYFWALFLAREVVEIGAQCYQVYRSSQLIARPWINNVSIIILAINCWSTPFWQYIFRQNVAMERIVCIVNDGILNMGTSLVLPLIVFLPYVYAFDPKDYVFPMEILYGDIEFTNFVMENQFVLTTSFMDGLAKVVSHCAIFTAFPAVRSLVRCTTPSSSSPTPFDTKKSTVPIRSTQPLGYRLIHAVFILGGVIVLSVHIHASLVSSSFQAEIACLQIMRPWFASRQPCAIYRVDCKPTGEDSPVPEVLNQLDELVLLNIYFMNCPQLQVPTSIQRFPNLIGVEVHNSTIAQWSVDAAIRAHLHPRMMYLIMVRVNMTGLPDGILQPLPPLLTDVELIHTNLTALPDDLDARWPNMALLFFEHGQIHEFPPVLLKMPIYELSLIGNRIEELPSLIAEYNVLSMANNPLTKLPETIDANAYVAFFSLDNTQVASLPPWIDNQVKEELYLMGTPFCAALEDGQSDLQQWQGNSIVKCDEPDPRASGRYPLELVDAMRSGSA